MKNLYIIRGISGVNKYIFGKSLCSSTLFDKHIELTELFDEDNIYDIKAEECYLEQLKEDMIEGYHKIFISIDSFEEINFESFNKLAKEYKYQVYSIIVEDKFK